MSADRFSDVLGSTRGPAVGAGLNALNPEARAHAQALTLCRQATDGEFDGALAALAGNGSLVSQRPLLQTVLAATVQALARETARAKAPAVRDLLDALGMSGRPSELCVELGDVVHVWPQGQGATEMTAGDATLCGLRGPGKAHRPVRGLVAYSDRACPSCLPAAEGRFPELTGDGYVYPVGRRRAGELDRMLPATAGAALTLELSVRALTSADARALCAQAHAALWAAEISERALAGGERVVRALLGAPRYRQLRGRAGPLTACLDVDMWRPSVEAALRDRNVLVLAAGIEALVS